jgi:WS/DGAT/MGAT family acyltransferase
VSAWELLFSPPDSGCVDRNDPAESKRAAWSAPVPLAQVKTIGRRMGGTVNDILLTATSGALRRCLQAHGEPLVDANVRAMVPVSFRTPGTEGELGNRIGIVLLSLPVDVPEPAERLRELKQRMDQLKGSVEAPMVYAAMRVFGSAPSRPVNALVDNLGDRATAIVTNVKGPQERLYLAGAPLEEFMFWTPRLGGVGLGVSIMSYDGQVRVGAITDEGTEFGPEVFIASFHEEFDALLAGVLQEPTTVKEMSALLDAALVTLDQVIAGEGAESRDKPEPATARCLALTKAGHPCKNHPQPGSSYCHVHA